MLLVASAIAFPTISMRSDPTMCLDGHGSTERVSAVLAKCDAASTTQAFFYDSASYVYANGSSISCANGPPCCLVHEFGIDDVTGIDGCSHLKPTLSYWLYDNSSTFQLSFMDPATGVKGCLAADAATVGSRTKLVNCSTSDLNQAWTVAAAPAPPPPHTCSVIGCNTPHTSGLCGCDTSCDARGDCCTDYQSICKAQDNFCRVLGCNHANLNCSCGSECTTAGDCCPDYDAVCSKGADSCGTIGVRRWPALVFPFSLARQTPAASTFPASSRPSHGLLCATRACLPNQLCRSHACDSRSVGRTPRHAHVTLPA